MTTIYNQQEFSVRLEWGLAGMQELSPVSDVTIIVDVLSFSTCVDIAVGKGAVIYPYRWKDESAVEYARQLGAEIADFNRKFSDGFSLSPASLLNIQAGIKLVLPSPNGSTLSLMAKDTIIICGCLRNAKAVAGYAISAGKTIAIIPAGEKWPDGTLRVAFEDLVGAGAIISYLQADFSPECKTALATFNSCKESLITELKNCSSGKELIERGFEKDVELAGVLNAGNTVPVLKDGYYVAQKS